MKQFFRDFGGVSLLIGLWLGLCAVSLFGFAPGSGTAMNNTAGKATPPTSVTMDWVTIVPAGGLDDVDANPVSNFGAAPTFTSGVMTTGSGLTGGDLATTAAAGTRKVIELKGMGGSTLVFRVKYPSAVAAGTSITFAVGGCGNGIGGTGTDYWDRLVQVGTGTRSITIATKATDMTDGTWKYTDVLPTVHAVDNKGSWCIVVGVEVTGFGSTAELQVKGF